MSNVCVLFSLFFVFISGQPQSLFGDSQCLLQTALTRNPPEEVQMLSSSKGKSPSHPKEELMLDSIQQPHRWWMFDGFRNSGRSSGWMTQIDRIFLVPVVGFATLWLLLAIAIANVSSISCKTGTKMPKNDNVAWTPRVSFPQDGILTDPEMHSLPDRSGPFEGCTNSPKWEAFWYKVFARLPFLHTLFALSMLLIVLPRFYRTAGIWINLTFISYGFLKFFFISAFALLGMHRIGLASQSSSESESEPNAPSTTTTRSDCDTGGTSPTACLTHCVVIPALKEDPSTLEKTIATLAEQTVASQIHVVLALEAVDPKAEDTAQFIRSRFDNSRLADIRFTIHRNAPTELPGKSSNENWAFRCAKKWLVDKQGIPMDRIIFTTADADSYFHPTHFEILNKSFFDSEDPHNTVWQGSLCLLPNSHKLPGICATRYMQLTVAFLGQLCNPVSPTGAFPLAVYSMSAKLAHNAGYWDPTIIPEDWHMFFKVNFEGQSGGVKVQPIYLPIGNLGVEGSTYLETISGCYHQAIRWQWGVTDLAYVLVQLFVSRTCPIMKKIMLIFGLYEAHMMIPTMWIAMVSWPFLYRDACFKFAAPWPEVIVHQVPMSHQFGGQDCAADATSAAVLASSLWIAFFSTTWITLIVADWVYRSLVAGRKNFEGVSQGRPPILRILSFALFPVADMAFFLIPSFYVHCRMFLSSQLSYTVAAKGASNDEKLPIQVTDEVSS